MKRQQRNSYIELSVILEKHKPVLYYQKKTESLHKPNIRAFVYKFPTLDTLLFFLYVEFHYKAEIPPPP